MPALPADVAELTRALEQCCADLARALEDSETEEPPARVPDGASPAAAANLRWRPLVLAPLPGLDQLISIVKPPVQVIIALLQLIKALLEALAAILLGIVDPFRALIEAAIGLLADIINDLLNTGAYLYADAPGITPSESSLRETGMVLNPAKDWTAGQKLGAPPAVPDAYQRWAARFAASFDDPGDPNRPIVSEGAPMQAVFIVMAAPSPAALRQMLYLLGKLLNVDRFKVAFEAYRNGPDPRRTRAREIGGVAPDWQSAKLPDLLPPLGKLASLPELLRGLLSSVDNLAGLIKNLAAAMQDKAQVLMQLAETLQAILDLLDALKSTGMYILPVATKSGPAGLQQAFNMAQNRPPGGYIGGICLLASGPNLAKASMLWELLGMSTVMDVLEGDITLSQAGDRLAAGRLGQTTKVLEKNIDAVKKEGRKFASTVGDEAEAFQKAIENLPEGALDSLGASKDQLLESARRSRAEAVALLESAGETFAYDDKAIADGVAQTKQAQRSGARSLALGLEPPAKKDKP